MADEAVMSILAELQEWYVGNCDGEWEHSYGIKIGTLDNPGWSLTVDLSDTPWAKLEVTHRSSSRSDTDWTNWRVTKAQFVGAGGPLNLEEIIRVFLEIVSERPAIKAERLE